MEPNELETYRLVPHPRTPPARVEAVEVELIDSGDDISIIYRVAGTADLIVPDPASPSRRDSLWETTCFELFLKPEGDGCYFEFNFSPSGEWAAYRLEGYRAGRSDLPAPVDPHIERIDAPLRLEVDVEVELSGLPNAPMRMGLCAVIEERGGRKSYWALAHPPGEPDFHDEACFALELPAAKPA